MVMKSHILEGLRGIHAAADGQADRRVVNAYNAGLGKWRAVRRALREELDRLIGVDRAERVFRETDRQRRALEWAWRGGGGGLTVGRRRPAAPDVAGALAEGDEHAHGGHCGEHGEGVALRLVERVYLVLRARCDREAGRGRGRTQVLVLVLRERVVQRRPHEHLQLRKVLLDDAQYPLVLPCRLQQATGE